MEFLCDYSVFQIIQVHCPFLVLPLAVTSCTKIRGPFGALRGCWNLKKWNFWLKHLLQGSHFITVVRSQNKTFRINTDYCSVSWSEIFASIITGNIQDWHNIHSNDSKQLQLTKPPQVILCTYTPSYLDKGFLPVMPSLSWAPGSPQSLSWRGNLWSAAQATSLFLQPFLQR